MNKYYVLRCSEDGDVSLTTYTKDELEETMNAGEDADFDCAEAEIPPEVLYDFASGECPLVIIKGEAIVPKAAERVKRWETE